MLQSSFAAKKAKSLKPTSPQCKVNELGHESLEFYQATFISDINRDDNIHEKCGSHQRKKSEDLLLLYTMTNKQTIDC